MTALLTRAEAMSRLRCSESKLERLYRAGKIAYTQRMAEYFADLSGYAERVRKIINAVEGR